MKKTMRLMTIIGVSIFCQLVSVGTPWVPQPYPQLEPFANKPRSPIAVPDGCDKLLSRGCKVTSSNPEEPLIGELSYITDGVKEIDFSTFVEVGYWRQWVQIDLGYECEIHAVCIWHDQLSAHRDVICQISNDPEFIDGVVTVFNNDYDNSAKLGVGKDMEFISTAWGRPFAVDAVKGRYVRCYSNGSVRSNSTGNGNSVTAVNRYTEIEVFGRPLKATQKVEDSKTSPMSEANTKLYDSLPEPPQGKVWLKIEYPRWSF